MSPFLQNFVREADFAFGSHPKSLQDLACRRISSAEYFDVAVLAGYSIGDIVRGYVSEGDIDPRVLDAFQKQYPNVGGFVDFIQSHSGDTKALSGIVSAVKGKLFEIEYLAWLNAGHLPNGVIAFLAQSPTQPGWDIVVNDANGHPLEFLQLKATESVGYIRDALTLHPEIDVVATHEVFSQISALDDDMLNGHVIDGNLWNEQISTHVVDNVESADLVQGFHIPYLALGLIALQSAEGYRRDKLTMKAAFDSALRRSWRSVVCRAVSYCAVLISGEPTIGAGLSLVTGLTFSRHDVQDGAIRLLIELTEAQAAKRIALTNY